MKKRKTTEKRTNTEFLYDLELKNSELYNSIRFLDDYVNSSVKLRAVNKYGIVLVTPYKLLDGRIPSIRSAINKLEYFKAMFKEVNCEYFLKILEFGGYTNSFKILIRDEFGWLSVSKTQLLSGHEATISVAVDKTTYAINKSRKIHGDVYDYSKSEFIKAHDNTVIICKEHGEFNQRFSSHFLGQGCPICGRMRTNEGMTYDMEKFLKELKLVNPRANIELEPISKYNGNCNNIIFNSKYGQIIITPSSLMRGSMPTIKSAIDKNNYAIMEFKECHGDEYDYSRYVYSGKVSKGIVICKYHKEFEVNYYHHKNGVGCPSCNESKLEKNIADFMDYNEIDYKREYRFKDCKHTNPLPFDFYIESMNTLIEADGKQHFEAIEFFGGASGFEKTKRNDEIKDEYCRDNDIELIRIPYWDYENIEEILIDKLNLKKE